MYSQEEYLVFAKEFLSPRLEKCREQMAVILNKKGNETRDALLSVMEQLFQRCIRQQKEGVKKPIRYIHFLSQPGGAYRVLRHTDQCFFRRIIYG